MADDERDEPSLELPSFGLGRRRARKDRFLEPDPLTAPLEQVEPAEPAGPVAEEPEPTPVPAARRLFVEESPAASPGRPASPVIDVPAAEPGGARKQRRERRERRERQPGGVAAVLATGLVVGALTVALTWLAQRGCDALRGTSSCGEPGLLVLLAIVVVAGLVGAAVLRLARVAAPGSTSALGVGLLAVVALLFLGGSLAETWAAFAVPALSVLTFAVSHWVTTSATGDDAG